MIKETKFKQTEIGMIPKDWKFDVLSKHLHIKGRIGWKGLQKSEYLKDSTGIAIINGTQIQDSKLDWTDCGRVPEWRYDESPEIQLKENDIVMTKDGTIGKVAFIDKLPEKSSVASGIFVIRSESGDIDQRFLFYYFKSPLFKWLIETRKEGSVIPHLYQRDFEEFPFAYPLINEQKSIAKIFSDLDSKIELNQQMNKTLESIGQAIFKHWFIDFEFPNEEGKPYKSSGGEMIYNEEFKKEIPKGWKVAKLGEIVEFAYGKSLPETKREEGNYPVIGSNGIIGFHSDYLVSGPGVVIGRKGTLGEVHWVEENFFPIDTTFYLIDKLKSKGLYFHYFMLKGKDFLKSSSDSAVPGLNRNAVYSNKIIIPVTEIILNYNNICHSIFKKKHNLQTQSQILSNIRDSLLPKLMSGKIRVPMEARS